MDIEATEGSTLLPAPLLAPLPAVQRDALLIDMHGRLAGLEVRAQALPALDDRVRTLEKRQWGLPATMLVALLSMLGIIPHS